MFGFPGGFREGLQEEHFIMLKQIAETLDSADELVSFITWLPDAESTSVFSKREARAIVQAHKPEDALFKALDLWASVLMKASIGWRSMLPLLLEKGNDDQEHKFSAEVQEQIRSLLSVCNTD